MDQEKCKIVEDFINDLQSKFPSLEGKDNKQKRIRLHLRVKKYQNILDEMKTNPEAPLPQKLFPPETPESDEPKKGKKRRAPVLNMSYIDLEMDSRSRRRENSISKEKTTEM